MPATSAPSVHDVRAEFESILANVLNEEGRHMTADGMERRLLRQLLALGRSLLALFLSPVQPPRRSLRTATPLASVGRTTASVRGTTCRSLGPSCLPVPTSIAKASAASLRWTPS